MFRLNFFTRPYSTTPKAQETIAALWRLEKIILDTLEFKDVVQKIVDSVLTELGYLKLGYHVVVLALIDQQSQTLKRVSFSNTQKAKQAIGALSLPFSDIHIPLDAHENLCIQAIQTKQPQITHSVADVFYPALSQAEVSAIQQAVGIKTTMVYPILSQGNTLGVLILSMTKSEQEVSPEEKNLIAGFTDVVGLAVQDSLLYSSLQEAHEKLKNLDQLKDEFISLVSHELRTPMTAIKLYQWMLLYKKDAGPLNEKQRLYVERTYLSTERLIKLVNEMLNVSRIEAGKFTVTPIPINLQTLANETLPDMLPTAAQKHITITIIPPGPLPLVLADPDKIKEVFINILGNSLKFTPPGGTITITFSAISHGVTTHVTDTGRGIREEDLPKLFHKFGMIEGNYLTKSIQGTGLGLYIARTIIELHGGRIWATSDGENKGTTFSFTLCLAPQQPTPQQAQQATPSSSEPGHPGSSGS